MRRASAPFSSRARARVRRRRRRRTRRFDAGAYVVDLAQPQGKVAHAILEPRRARSAFARAQIDKFERNHRRGKNAERRATSSTTSPRGRCLSRSASRLLDRRREPPSPATCSRSPPSEPALPQAQPAAATDRRRAARRRRRRRHRRRAAVRRRRTCSVPSATARSQLAYHLLAEGFRVAVAVAAHRGRRPPLAARHVRRARRAQRLHARARASTRSPARAASK